MSQGKRTTHLLYLHGFRSSPQSTKARAMAEWVRLHHPRVHWWCPALPPSPQEAMDLVDKTICQWPQESMAVVGSSLGGFYATWVAKRYHCKAVLLNPAVDPARDLQRYIGEQSSWHDPAARFYFAPHFVDELRALQCGPLQTPKNYLAIIAKGDEVLDWREMTTRYAACPTRLIEGSDHALSDFDAHLPAVLRHLQLA